MTLNLNTPSNKNKIAIVAVGYNRQKALSRLLDSLNNAQYPSEDVPLVISIDASGDQKLYEYVWSFEWKHGPRYVNIQEERLGLKNHIFQCFSLTHYFKGVILLEDDLYVSPYYYYYAEAALDKYGDEERVAGVALYTNETNGFKDLPFQPEYGKWDVFAWQVVCSWGEMLNERMWNAFSKWMENWDGNIEAVDMNSVIKGWSRAWSKYMYSYLVQTNRYFIYPYMSLTTNFNDAGGEHGGGDGSLVQVSLLQGDRRYQMGPFSELVCYDVYSHNVSIAKWLGLKPEELTVDFYGLRDTYYGRYVLSPYRLPYKLIRGFRLAMRPWELNIKYNVKGNDILLYDRQASDPCPSVIKKFPDNYIKYYFKRYRANLTLHMVLLDYWHRIKSKVFK